MKYQYSTKKGQALVYSKPWVFTGNETDGYHRFNAKIEQIEKGDNIVWLEAEEQDTHTKVNYALSSNDALKLGLLLLQFHYRTEDLNEAEDEDIITLRKIASREEL